MNIPASKIGGKRAKKLVEKGALLIDVRSPVNFRDGSIPGAVNLSLRQISSLVREPKTKTLIFFGETEADENLVASTNYAAQMGFTQVFSLGTKENWDK